MQVDQIGGALGLALDTGKILLLDFQDVWTAPHEQGVDLCKGRRSSLRIITEAEPTALLQYDFRQHRWIM